MGTETAVTAAAAQAAATILHDYLAQGGAIPGVEASDVAAFLAALVEADRIVIAQAEG